MDTMTCNRCLLTKPLEEFPKNKRHKNGHEQPCRECKNKKNRASHATWHAINPLIPSAPEGMKRCRDCLELQPLENFPQHKHKNGKHYPGPCCVPCHATVRRAYRIAHAEEITATNIAYKAAHHEEGLANAIAYYWSHVEEKAAYNCTYYSTNKEKYAALARANRAAKPEEYRVRECSWRDAHPEECRIYSARRRAREAEDPINDLTAPQWLEILISFNYRCAYCLPDCIECRKKTHELAQEHITAVANNGSYTLHNIVPACRSCNSKKHTGPAPVPVQPLLLTIAPSKKKKAS